MGNKFEVVIDDEFQTELELFLLAPLQKCALGMKTLDPFYLTRVPDYLLQALTYFSKWL